MAVGVALEYWGALASGGHRIAPSTDMQILKKATISQNEVDTDDSGREMIAARALVCGKTVKAQLSAKLVDTYVEKLLAEIGSGRDVDGLASAIRTALLDVRASEVVSAVSVHSGRVVLLDQSRHELTRTELCSTMPSLPSHVVAALIAEMLVMDAKFLAQSQLAAEQDALKARKARAR